MLQASSAFSEIYKENTKRLKAAEAEVVGEDFKLKDGDIVIAAITSAPTHLIQMFYWSWTTSEKRLAS